MCAVLSLADHSHSTIDTTSSGVAVKQPRPNPVKCPSADIVSISDHFSANNNRRFLYGTYVSSGKINNDQDTMVRINVDGQTIPFELSGELTRVFREGERVKYRCKAPRDTVLFRGLSHLSPCAAHVSR